MLISRIFLEFTPTESTARETLLHIADNLAYQRRHDLNLYQKNYIESTSIVITNLTKTNIIVGCIYRYPIMDLNEFNCYILIHFQKNQPKNKKTVFLLGNFNVDLLKHEQHKATNEFFHSLSSNLFLPYIIQPSRINSHSKYIIENIFSNFISQEIMLGNLTSTISENLSQFLIAPHIFLNALNKKFSNFELD